MPNTISVHGRIEQKWNDIKGSVKERWPELPESQLNRINGGYDQLVDLLQETYGYTTQKARQEVDAFVNRLDDAAD
jgi:uncharacterized protein YjbJ (UPF0337 family)